MRLWPCAGTSARRASRSLEYWLRPTRPRRGRPDFLADVFGAGGSWAGGGVSGDVKGGSVVVGGSVPLKEVVRERGSSEGSESAIGMSIKRCGVAEGLRNRTVTSSPLCTTFSSPSRVGTLFLAFLFAVADFSLMVGTRCRAADSLRIWLIRFTHS